VARTAVGWCTSTRRAASTKPSEDRRALGQVDRTAGAGRQRELAQANLAELLAARGEFDESFELFTDVLERQRETIADVGSFASERQQMDMVRDLRLRVSQYVSLVMRHFGDSPAHVRRAADLVLDRKSLGADLLARQREAVLSARYPELRERFERLAKVRAGIAQRSLAGPNASAPEGFAEELRQARLNREALERELAREIPELAARRLDRTADCAAVACATPPTPSSSNFCGMARSTSRPSAAGATIRGGRRATSR